MVGRSFCDLDKNAVEAEDQVEEGSGDQSRRAHWQGGGLDSQIESQPGQWHSSSWRKSYQLPCTLIDDWRHFQIFHASVVHTLSPPTPPITG
jgi:hypothetical protein